ncbi:MAG: M3 family metallopeptidase [Campylobacterales bacterium]
MKLLNYTKNALVTAARKLPKEIAQARARVDELASLKKVTFETVVIPFAMIQERLGWTFGLISHLDHVNNSEQTHRYYIKALEAMTKFQSELWQDKQLYSQFVQLRKSATLTPFEARCVDKIIKEFKLGGVSLRGGLKKRLQAIQLELSQLESSFSQNLLEATNSYEMIVTNEADLGTMPEADRLAALIEQDGKQAWRFTLQAPSYLAFMTHSPNRTLREQLYRAYSTRAPNNGPIIDRILQLRAEQAKILGFNSFADLSFATKDAPSPERVITFLRELAQAARPYAKQELDELRQIGQQEGIDEIAAYDVAYLSEKLKKKKLDIDEEAYRPYFEKERVIEGLLAFVQELFGIHFKPLKTPIWHPSVKVFDLHDHKNIVGRLYLDLENRPTKRSGAWMDSWSSYCVDEHGMTLYPVVHIVANFPPATEGRPSLLKHSDVETLFHEMGHALHHLLSRVLVASFSGVNGVAWDTVEFPSQFFENFAFEADVLRRFSFHYESGEALPDEMITRLKAVKNFQAGVGILRQIEFALFDLMLHQRLYQQDEVQELLDRVRDEISLLPPPSYNRFQHSFSHIFAGGYAAGYYSYKWAEVMSADLFMALADNPSLAPSIKRHLFEKGGSEDMGVIFKAILGRDPDPQALIRFYGLNEKI